MKKIVPILTLVGAGLVFGGCNFTIANTQQKSDNSNFLQNINEFKNNIETCANLNTENLNKIKLNKYNLALAVPEINLADDNNLKDNLNLSTTENLIDETNNLNNDENREIIKNEINKNLANTDTNSTIENVNEQIQNSVNQTETTAEDINKISTLYSLTNDVDESCGDFCTLKQSLANAIIETQNLISKVQNKEIELTAEQRMFLTEQSKQLKSLGKQLTQSTTELNIYLSDLHNLLQNDADLDQINLKYLVVLDNLINGNEMLENGLNSLNLINSMFNMSDTQIPNNNRGRILYGFRRNNEEPIVKDYLINENGEIKENLQSENKTDEQYQTNQAQTNEVDKQKTTTIDTYKNNKLQSNIDTYYGNNRRNIDSFFNTALLDNEFMYGTNGYGYGPMMGGNMNPYMNNMYRNDNVLNNTQQGENYNNNSTNGVNQADNTQQIEKKAKKKFKFKKNIDSYKDENTPSLKTKFSNIKKSVNSFMGKFSKGKKDDATKNPIYQMDDTTNTTNNY